MKLANSRTSITLGGQVSTMEAIFSNTPLCFYLPSNLSQVIQQKAYSLVEKNISEFSWNLLGYSDKDFLQLDEKQVIEFIDKISKKVNQKEISLISKVLREKITLLSRSSATYPTLKKIMGRRGSQQIVNDVFQKIQRGLIKK